MNSENIKGKDRSEILKPLVLYITKTGNTRSIAKEIGNEISLDESFIIDIGRLDDIEIRDFWNKYSERKLIFFGTGTYATGLGKDMKNFENWVMNCNFFWFYQ